ncbi:MAG TPA: hypothetical protein VK497_05020 [Candidatus Saccharimonadales bacterium]|nr:hypothetical protein [Candidatus Saccharimonadales bacterium]
MTYLPPMNGGRINATIGGNTAGAGALVSSGTLTFAGGNNITLSQAGNAITISGAAGGLTNINVSGSNSSSNMSAIKFSNSNGVSFGLTTGSVITASHNGLTSQSNQALSAANGSFTFQTATFANSNGISFSTGTQGFYASHNGITSQTNQTLGINVTGNTLQTNSGTVDARSLTFNGLGGVSVGYSNGSVQISGGAGGGGGGIALANSQTTYTSGTANLAVAGGAMTIASTTGQSFNFSVPQTSSLSATGALSISTNGSTISMGVPAFSAGISNIGNTAGTSGTASNQVVFAGGNNITLSQSTDAGGNTITISAGAGGGGGAQTMDFYQNMDRGGTAVLGTTNNSVFFQRLNQENANFAANITANTVLLNMSGNMNTSSSSSHTMTVHIGVYSDNVTNLSLLNSASTSWGFTANTSNSANYQSARWLSFVSSQWSSLPAFAEGGEYVFGLLIRSTGFGPPLSWIGQNYMTSAQRGGTIGVSVATATTLAQGNYWNGLYSASSSVLPTVVSSNQVNRNHAMAIFIPHVILNNRYSGTF